MPKQMLSGDQARAAIERGVNQVADMVKVTLGPRGRNVLLDRPGMPLATRDGVTVAKEVSDLPCPYENMGASFVREVADAAVIDAGDGTTTATVLLQAIVNGGLKLVGEGAEPLLLADGIAAAAEAVTAAIRAMAVKATPELVRQVAVISTHGDIELGQLIADAVYALGEHGVAQIHDGSDSGGVTEIEHLEGFYFERGWANPRVDAQAFLNDPSGKRCVLLNPLILISERIIAGATPGLQGDHLINLAQACAVARRPLLIVAEDLTGDALNMFSVNVAQANLPGGCFVKLPGFGAGRSGSIQDLRIAIGARRIHSLTSTSVADQLSNFTIDDLGTCERAIISPDMTVLIRPGGAKEQVDLRVRQLLQHLAESTNLLARQELELRIARLTSGVSLIKVGAHSEPAMIEKKARAEDAVHACKGAMQQGVVPGGGVALLRAVEEGLWASAMPGDGPDPDSAEYAMAKDRHLGMGLLLRAITEPARQIVRNAGHKDVEAVFQKIFYGSGSWGYNAATGQFGDLYESGVVDPAKVVLVALQKAASIGALILTSEALCANLPVTLPGLPPMSSFRMG